MIEGIVQIGKALYNPDDPISNFIIGIEPTRKNRQLSILKINFNLKQDKVEIDVSEEMDKYTSQKYTFVGSADGSNSAQWYVSSTSSNYHLTETFYNLSSIDFGEELNTKIKKIFNSYYVDFGDELKPKYRYALDLAKCGVLSTTMEELYEEIKREIEDEKELGKKLLEKIKGEFEAYLNNEKGIDSNDIGLYTIFIDGEPLSNFKEYKDAVIESKKPKTKYRKEVMGVCSICGSNEDISSDMTKMKIKYYTTNQVIFASDLSSNNYYKNMQMCSDCMSKFLAGENYILNQLKTKLASFDVYIIPQFVYGEPLNEEELNIVTKNIIDSFNTVKSMDGIENLRKNIIGSVDLREKDSYFLLNFMFFKSSQKATKIQRLVKDINPSIFEKISNASIRAKEDFNYLLGRKFKGTITLNTIYYMTPIRLKKGEATQYRDILEIYDAILTGKSLNKRHIINNIIECTKIIKLSKESYNINPEKEVLEFFMMRANMYIKFLEYMGCLKEGKVLDVSSLNLRDNVKNYIEKIGYDEQETAMFLLGYLIGEIGNVQYKKTEEGNKPILNKLNFNGLDEQKIIRLTKDVFDKLNQEKIRQYNEVTFFEMKRLLDANIENWDLNKDESLFYVLSGYSYATTLPMLREGVSNDK
ncbi:TIGR02556 family CRISPR-associated protein [Sporanaerobacter acetigenes]|uniref:CRISPR-associated protein, Csh1 family n=1 Tax=Sporanaerobacter acetigenes DSM 13106 TaxID=1123281 RepID=A0A1M5YYT1_9FIRM|nr:TIGR02556 family CRISPR-associated protein [Sporanaerobacter acetigenes]SHI17171.1 CRISPR-associated protein, Csh1 family [Sporanaerobacter acetigenes DSM 13106]